jgi:hypothetical protein
MRDMLRELFVSHVRDACTKIKWQSRAPRLLIDRILAMRMMGKLTTVIAVFAGSFRALAFGAGAQTNLCALLPQSDVSSVVGTPVKLAEGRSENGLPGTGIVRSQTCNYDPPGGIGSGPATVRVTFSEGESPAAAARMLKAQLQFLPGVAGKGEALSGVGDEAQSFHTPGSVSMRKKAVIVDIHVGLRDLNLDKEVAMGKALALTIAAHVP